MKRVMAFFLMCALLFGTVEVRGAASNYYKFSNAKHGFGLGLNTVHQTPGNGEAVVFPKYDALYYAKTKEKKIFLTFDCGYENGHTKTILDTLKENDIKAIFFVTKSYIEGNPGLVKRMKREGHLVGNHTVNHPSLPDCSVERVQSEIRECASYMKKKTGYALDRYMRPPMGEWSERVLKAAQDLGYITVFWSMAFYDYDEANQPGADAIYNQFMKYYHKGAVPLIHVISRSDTEALPAVLRDMQALGYVFCRLDQAEREIYAAKVKQKENKKIYRRLNGEVVQGYECHYPIISRVGKAASKINQDIEKLRKNFKAEADAEYLVRYGTWRDNGTGREISRRFYEQKMKVVYNKKGILSLRVKEYSYARAAAHSVTCDNSVVYDLKSGKKVSLARLLAVSSNGQANRCVKKAMTKKFGHIQGMKDKIKRVKYGDYNYYLTKNGRVKIVFNLIKQVHRLLGGGFGTCLYQTECTLRLMSREAA